MSGIQTLPWAPQSSERRGYLRAGGPLPAGGPLFSSLRTSRLSAVPELPSARLTRRSASRARVGVTLPPKC
jgi:hypothetical protein